MSDVVFIEGEPPAPRRSWESFKVQCLARPGKWAVFSEGGKTYDRPYRWGPDWETRVHRDSEGTCTTWVRYMPAPVEE